ncbi:MAG TPA: hypothetical protein VLF60_03755 [Candidatus Saccharimonadales bacterium]|nr:hypothetical protein [Candidatus Saccharimonadales bacterium]
MTKKVPQPTTDKSPTRTRQVFLGIRGVVEGYSRRTLIMIVVGNLLLAAGVIGGVWYYYGYHHKPKVQVDEENGDYRRVQKLKSQSVPSDPMSQVVYYSQLAQNYSSLKQYDQALQNFFLAQSSVERNKLQDSFDFTRAIGDTYLAQGNKAKAKEYYNKEIDRLTKYIQQHPDNPGNNQDVINDLQAQVQKL